MQDTVYPIPILYTFETPIQNVAFSRHGVWVEQKHKPFQEGSDCAIYYEPYTNLVHTSILDAIFLKIYASGGEYHIQGFATFPGMDREEIKIDRQYVNYYIARVAAFEWLLAARDKIGKYSHEASF